MFRRSFALVATLLLALGLTAGPARAVTAPAEAQFAWLVGASTRFPVPAGELAEHLDQTVLGALGGADGFNHTLQPYVPFVAGATVWSSPAELRRVVSTPAGPMLLTIAVDAAGLVSGLNLGPYLPAPASWAAVDKSLRGLAPRVSFAATRITSTGCTLVHGVDPATARPLGSAFKLYVLGALTQAVKAGRLSWDDVLAINPAWKSLTSGVLQDAPDGTRLTLAQYADYMIAISDNTAADHLIHEVGRAAVQRQFTTFGNQAPNKPVLTTRELFALKGWKYPTVAAAYAALPVALRAKALPGLDRVPLTAITGWQQPEMIDKLEWFGSPLDLCRAWAGLWEQHDPQAEVALTLNDGGIGVSPAAFPAVWFKGGSEPGVLTLNYLAQAADGSLITASLMLSDPAHPLPESTSAQALAVLRGSLTLAAGA